MRESGESSHLGLEMAQSFRASLEEQFSFDHEHVLYDCHAYSRHADF
jgi:hypothetical protein